MLANVIIPLKLPTTLTYSIPEGMRVTPGCRVQVPVGNNKTYTGIVTQTLNEPTNEHPSLNNAPTPTNEHPTPIATPTMLRLWQWIASYYLCPIGDVMRAALPAKLKSDAKRKKPKPITWDPITNLPRLTPTQQQALTSILQDPHPVTLLHGVTASGKTAIYQHLIALTLTPTTEATTPNPENQTPEIPSPEALAPETLAPQAPPPPQVLYLVPEIALTTQLETRLRAVFGNRIAVFHSKMTDARRAELWECQLSTDPYPIILGARSSVFLPFQNLRRIIIDEEHEMSYKQQDPAPRYHARNVALMLARFTAAHTLLGSATPSMESYYHARLQHYGLVTLTEKYTPTTTATTPTTSDTPPATTLTTGDTTPTTGGTPPPATTPSADTPQRTPQRTPAPRFIIANTAELRRKKRMRDTISPPLRDAIAEALDRHEQIILFQNRRGYAPHVECNACGWTPRCVKCDVSLTMHRRANLMVCHTCGTTYTPPVRCPNCSATDFRPHGAGTEKVEEEIRTLFPSARVSRLDLDAAKSQSDIATIVTDFEQGNADILIGTQMVTKGLDFRHVSVVGIIAADTALNVPDFRAYERAYELMAQVAGRAGRQGAPATVILQTRQPDLPVIRHVVRNDYTAHYLDIMRERMEFCYPPFCRLIDIYFKHRYENVTIDIAQSFTHRILQANFPGVEILGPDAPAKARVSNLYLRKAVLKIRPEADLTAVKSFLLSLFWEYLHSTVFRQPLIVFDVDPNN